MWHLPCARHCPESVKENSLDPHDTLRCMISLSKFHRCRNGTERSGHLLKGPWLVSGEAGIHTGSPWGCPCHVAGVILPSTSRAFLCAPPSPNCKSEVYSLPLGVPDAFKPFLHVLFTLRIHLEARVSFCPEAAL